MCVSEFTEAVSKHIFPSFLLNCNTKYARSLDLSLTNVYLYTTLRFMGMHSHLKGKIRYSNITEKYF